MKLYFTSKTLKKIIFFLLGFLISSIIIFYSQTLNVQALTTSNFDKSSSYLGFTLRDGTSMGNIHKEIYFDQPVDFSIYDTKYDNLYLFSTDIIFPEYEELKEYFSISSSVHFYLTLHFKYSYDITNTNYFSTSHLMNITYDFGRANIYENKIYTSISEDGKITYDEFITFDFPYTFIPTITDFGDKFHIYNYLDFPEIPNLGLSVDLINAMFTSDNATPISIDEYISSSGETYYSPEDLPYSETTSEDNFITRMISDILNGIKDFGITVWIKIKAAFNYLFVPSEGFFSSAWDATVKLLEDNLGFLFFPFKILEKVLNLFLNLGEGSGIIHIPELKDPFYSQTLVSAQDLNLKQIFSTGAVGTAHEVYLVVIDVIVIVGLISLCFKKFNSIFKGGQ